MKKIISYTIKIDFSAPRLKETRKFPTKNRDGLPSEDYPVAVKPDLHHSTTGRSLVTHEFCLVHAGTPERAKAAMGRTSDRILIDPNSRSKETGNEIIFP